MRFRMLLPLALVAVGLAFLVSTPARAAEKEKGERKGAAEREVWRGRIESVDVAKRQLVLENAREGRPGRGGPGRRGPGAGAGGGALSAQNAEEEAEKEKGEKGRKITFHVARNAEIMVDGEKKDLDDLKAGMFALVFTGEGGGKGPRPEGGARPGAGSSQEQQASEEEKEKSAKGEHHRVAHRVLAFTKPPQGGPGRRGGRGPGGGGPGGGE